MFNKIIFLIGTTLLLLVDCVISIELIELTDANKNLMHIDDSKALETIQTGLRSDLKFKHVKDAKNFIVQCRRLSYSMEGLDDDDYRGLAAKIKVLLREEPLLSLCHVKTTKLDEYSLLDEKEEGSFYLSQKRFNGLVAIGRSLDRHPKIKQVLGHLYNIKVKNTGEFLLKHASEDTSIFFGELDSSGFFQTKYHSGCSVSAIEPICKLVRGTEVNGVTAHGSDIAEFIEAISAHNKDKLEKHILTSGVTMDTLRSNCKSIDEDLYPMQLIRKYKEAKFLDMSQIENQKDKDPDFHFYFELERLCEMQKRFSGIK